MRATVIYNRIGFLDELVYDYNDAYHNSIKERPVNNDYSINSQNFEVIDKIPKFKVGEIVGIVRYKNIFTKRCIGN